MTTDMESVFRIQPASELPAGYTQLEYISSVGAFLVTSINTILGDKVTVKFSSPATASGNRYIFGQGMQSSSGGVKYTSTGLSCGWGTGSWANIALNLQPVNTLEASADKWTLNGTEITGYGLGTFYGGTYSLFRWAGLRTDDVLNIHSFVVENNGSLRCNIIPAMRNSDNEVGMYDLVNNTFLASTSADIFTAGPAIEVCKISQNNQTIWERAISMTSTGDGQLSFRSTRNSTYTPLKELNAYGGTEKRKRPELWSQYLPVQTLVPTTYPMKDSQGRIAVQDIGLDGTKTGAYGYFNTTTKEFTQVSGMTGNALSQINYIEGTGSQYILPNLTGNVKWKIVAQGTKKNAQQVLTSSSQSGADGTWIGEIGSTGKWGIGDNVASTVDVSAKAELEIDFTSTTQNGMINGELIAHPTSAVHNTWALMGTSVGNYCFTGKLYSAQAEVNGELVRDYMPIQAGGVYCLLDKINWEIVGSASGTGFNGSSAVITPDDIISNNGVIKYGYKDLGANLPSGYERLEYIESTSTQYINTGINPNNDTKITAYFKSTNTSVTQALIGARNASSGDERNSFTIWENVAGRMRFDYQSAQISQGQISTIDWNYVVKENIHNYLNGAELPSNLEATFTCDYPLVINAINTNGTIGNIGQSTFGVVEIYQDGTILSFKGIPAKRTSDNVLGMYDLVSQTFFENAGTGSFTAGNIIQRELYAEGTQEKILTAGNCGVVDASTLNWYYGTTFSINIADIDYEIGNNNIILDGYSYIGLITAVSQLAEREIGVNRGTSKIYIKDNRYTSTTAFKQAMLGKYLYYQRTTDETWNAPIISNVEMLNKIGTYEDVQNIVTGDVTKNVGIKVFDGTEDWKRGSSTLANYTYYLKENSIALLDDRTILSTHFLSSPITPEAADRTNKIYRGLYSTKVPLICIGWNYETTTVGDLKSWLASEYAKGTPVIIVYPLATPTTSTVPAQAITVNKGTYKAIAEGSLDNLKIEAKYLGNN